MSLARQGFGTFLARILGFACATGASIMLARLLGPSGKGVYALAVLAADLLLAFVHAGVGSAAVHDYGKGRLTLREIVPAFFWLSAGLGLGSIAAYLLAAPWLQRTVLREVPPGLALAAVMTVPVGILAKYLNYLQLARNRIAEYNWVYVSPNLVAVLGLAVLAAAGKLSVATAVCVWIASQVVQTVVAAALALRGVKLTWRLKASAARSLLSYGMRVQMVMIANQLHYRGDLLLLGYFRNSAQVGLYTIAVGIGSLLTFLPESIGVVLFRRVSADAADRSEVSAIAGRLTLVIMLVAAGVAALAAPWLVPLVYGSKFVPSVAGVWALLPGIVGLGLFKVVSSDLMGRGRPGLVGAMSFTGLAVNVLANLILIPRYSFVGAAAASSISYCLLSAMVVISFLRMTKLPAREVLLPRPADLRRALASLRGRGRSRQSMPEDSA